MGAMFEFLQAMLEFPTVVFTMLLGVVAVYWLFVIVGALDLHAVDGAHGATGFEHHASDGLVDGVHADGGADFGHEAFPAVLDAMGIRGVPLTVWLSLVILLSWAFSLLGMQVAGAAMAALAGWSVTGAIVTVASLALAIAATSVLVRPIRKLNVVHTAVSNRTLVGKVCTITTMHVDGHFGQAEIADGGAGLIVQVRCAEPNDLTRGSQALIFEYDSGDGVFNVARFDDAPDARHSIPSTVKE
jgi:hypothetical protein